MPDTRITRTANGWIDKDTGDFYPNRRTARIQRRSRAVRGVLTKGIVSPNDVRKVVGKLATGPVDIKLTSPVATTTVSASTGVKWPTPPMTGLQRKLFSRLTTEQGVSSEDAKLVVTTLTYNKAASYGYMRAAGATHDEAYSVVERGVPALSINYSKLRAAGNSHDMAVKLAGV